MIDYLGYSFLIIFNLTAILALLSLPGWITIDEKYKKPLFYGVIIEVAIFIVSLATLEYLDKPGYEVDIPEVKIDDNWLALELYDFSLIQPELRIHAPDTTITRKLGKAYEDVENRLKNNQLWGEYTNNGISVLLQDSLSLGYINRETLSKMNLFNSIRDQEKKEIAHTRISFEEQDNSWITKQELNDLPFEIKVRRGDHGIQYELWKNSVLVYNSVNSRNPADGSTSIWVDRRINHIFEENGKYFLLYIQHADLIKGYIHFSLIKLEPILANR